MTGLQYSDLYKSNLQQYQRDIDQKINDELRKEKPDITRLNQLRQAKYITPIFGDFFNGYERFRSPW